MSLAQFNALKDLVNSIDGDVNKFYDKGNKAAGTRVRKAMQDVKKLAQDIRSQCEATKTRMNAETDRTYTVKLAEARKQAEIIRGQGDAERNRVFAEAFQRDPEFFSFYRSMQAYAKSLGTDGTTMVLKPDSEYFKYFGSKTPAAAPQPQQ